MADKLLSQLNTFSQVITDYVRTTAHWEGTYFHRQHLVSDI